MIRPPRRTAPGRRGRRWPHRRLARPRAPRGSRLTFLGAASTVTGSKFLLETRQRRYLIEAGLFQGPNELEDRNFDPLPVEPSALDAVLLTHAHLDHSGYVPRLIADGYRGRVYASEATCALLAVLWPDSGYLMEEQAVYANRKHYARFSPALPLYTEAEARHALGALTPIPVGRTVPVDDQLHVHLRPAGHILGSCTLECRVGAGALARRIVFSGDLGRYGQPFMNAPEPVRDADYLVVESTYGGTRHDPRPVAELLAAIVLDTARRGGVLIIPGFAVGRTQEVLYHLHILERVGAIPSLPVFVDSPMATDASALYLAHGSDPNLKVRLREDNQAFPLRTSQTSFVQTVEASKRLNAAPGPFILVSASGMCSGGRVIHHLKHRLPDPRNTVLLAGFQAPGSRGAALRGGATAVRIHGESVPVRARIAAIGGFSAHGDASDLQRWLGHFHAPPERTFVVHGEPKQSAALAIALQRQHWEVGAPAPGDTYELAL